METTLNTRALVDALNARRNVGGNAVREFPGALIVPWGSFALLVAEGMNTVHTVSNRIDKYDNFDLMTPIQGQHFMISYVSSTGGCSFVAHGVGGEDEVEVEGEISPGLLTSYREILRDMRGERPPRKW
jgi:hypothetical protein